VKAGDEFSFSEKLLLDGVVGGRSHSSNSIPS
jgi:hypothetical protein